MIQARVTVSGPIFDGTAQAAVDDFLTEAKEVVADEGANRVKARLGQVLRNPSGYYESQIQTDRQQDDRQVTDSGVIYGPWLEGTGSRTDIFPGYHTFRDVAQDLDRDAGRLAEQVLPKHLEVMNG